MTTLKCMQHRFCQLCGLAIIINKNIKSLLSLRTKQIHGLKNWITHTQRPIYKQTQHGILPLATWLLPEPFLFFTTHQFLVGPSVNPYVFFFFYNFILIISLHYPFLLCVTIWNYIPITHKSLNKLQTWNCCKSCILQLSPLFSLHL